MWEHNFLVHQCMVLSHWLRQKNVYTTQVLHTKCQVEVKPWKKWAQPKYKTKLFDIHCLSSNYTSCSPFIFSRFPSEKVLSTREVRKSTHQLLRKFWEKHMIPSKHEKYPQNFALTCWRRLSFSFPVYDVKALNIVTLYRCWWWCCWWNNRNFFMWKIATNSFNVNSISIQWMQRFSNIIELNRKR